MKVLALHPSMKAQILSVVQPLTGQLTDYRRELVPRLVSIQAMWRRRVFQLHEEGWQAVQSKRVVYIRNCPPSTCGYSPQTQSCNLRICPFCHARRVADVYERIHDLLQSLDGSHKVVAFRKFNGQYSDADRIYLDADMGLTGTFLKTVYPRHRKFRQTFQKERMSEAIGGIYWYTIAPYTYQKDSIDGSIGRWNGLHGCIAVMPGDWKSWNSDDVKVIKDPDDYQLAWLVGRTFQYRQQWMTSDPSVCSALLNATHGDIFLTAFGRLGPNSGKR